MRLHPTAVCPKSFPGKKSGNSSTVLEFEVFFDRVVSAVVLKNRKRLMLGGI